MTNFPKEELEQFREQLDELKAPIVAVHGAVYAECIVTVSDLVLAYGNSVTLICGKIPALAVDLINAEMANKINNINGQYLKMLFTADLKDHKKMDAHYETFTNHVMTVTEARTRQLDRIVDRFKNYREQDDH